MALTGDPDGPPAAPAFDVIAGVESLFSVLEHSAKFIGGTLQLDTRLLTERAALLGLRRGGVISCNRSCRFIEAKDGWIAVNLPRESDLRSVPAWIGGKDRAEPWPAIAEAARTLDKADLVAAGRLLSLAVSEVAAPMRLDASQSAVPWAVHRIGAGGAAQRDWRRNPPLVVDLSALWAGPLCGSMLAALGARVIKVESSGRPDSIRNSCPAFFDSLNGTKQSVVLDFTSASDRAHLAALIVRSDVVISSARPRAFKQLGLTPESLTARNPTLTWVAVTAHGWSGADSNAVGFGDDAAAAAGLNIWAKDGRPMFIGDAIADPLTGIAAATGALHGIQCGGGVLVDANLRATAASVVRAGQLSSSRTICVDGTWYARVGGVSVQVAEPRVRAAARRAPSFGADTADVLRDLG